MQKKAKRKKEVYNSVAEFEKVYLPSLYRKKHEEQSRREPPAYGTTLAKEILTEIKRALR